MAHYPSAARPVKAARQLDRLMISYVIDFFAAPPSIDGTES